MSTTTDDGYASWWTPQQTADYLGRSVNTLAKWRSLQTHLDLPWANTGTACSTTPTAYADGSTATSNHAQAPASRTAHETND